MAAGLGVLAVRVLSMEDVQRERKMQEAKKMPASHAVNFFNMSAVAVPNKDSELSPPAKAPRPELLLSWIKMTKQS